MIRVPIVAAIFFGLVAVLLSAALIPMYRMRRLIRDGTATAGTVVGQFIMPGKAKRYRIRYSFKTADGTEITNVSTISLESFEKATTGSSLTVLYNPANPSRSLPYEYCIYEVIPSTGVL